MDQLRAAAGFPDCAHMPTYGDDTFAHLVDPHVLAVIDLPGASLDARLPALLGYLEVLSQAIHGYLDRRCPAGIEFVALTAASLEASAAVMPLADKFLADFDPTDPTYQVRLGGRDDMRAGTVKMVRGLATALPGLAIPVPATAVGRRFARAVKAVVVAMPPGSLDPALSLLEAPVIDDAPARRMLREAIRAELLAR